MRDGRVSVFMGMGGNFASATPDTAVTEAALRRCALTVQVSTKLNRSHLVHGATALILPTLGRTDRDTRNGRKQLVSVEDSMSMVHLSRGSLHPPSDQVRSEVQIICQLACVLFGPDIRCHGNGSQMTTTPSVTPSPRWCPAVTTTTTRCVCPTDSTVAPAARCARIPYQHRQS